VIRLNGWRRLWVLVSVIWAALVLFVGLTVWPEPTNWFAENQPDYNALANKQGSLPAQTFNDRLLSAAPDNLSKSDFEIWMKPRQTEGLRLIVTRMVAADESESDIANVIRHDSLPDALGMRNPQYLSTDPNAGAPLTIIKSEPLATLESTTLSSRTSLAPKRSEWAGTLLAIWAVPSALVYAFGAGVAWVRRGFRLK
jgi:hypothetical protein